VLIVTSSVTFLFVHGRKANTDTDITTYNKYGKLNGCLTIYNGDIR